MVYITFMDVYELGCSWSLSQIVGKVGPTHQGVGFILVIYYLLYMVLTNTGLIGYYLMENSLGRL